MVTTALKYCILVVGIVCKFIISNWLMVEALYRFDISYKSDFRPVSLLKNISVRSSICTKSTGIHITVAITRITTRKSGMPPFSN